MSTEQLVVTQGLNQYIPQMQKAPPQKALLTVDEMVLLQEYAAQHELLAAILKRFLPFIEIKVEL